MIRNVWRWIKYYGRRKKIYRKDGTVLMPSIRSYDLLDCATGDKQGGKLLPWPSPAIPTATKPSEGMPVSLPPAPWGIAARLRELYVAVRRSPGKQVSQRPRLRNASIR